MMQNPGATEEREGKPAVGDTGRVLNSVYLPKAGLHRDGVQVCNALRCRVAGRNELPPLNLLSTRAALAHCNTTHFSPNPDAKLYVAMGAYALYFLTGEGIGPRHTISSWRGWLLPWGVPYEPLTRLYHPEPGKPSVFATMHLAALVHDPGLKIALSADWQRIGRYLRGTWPERLPVYHVGPPVHLPTICTFDTEYDIDTGELYRYSMHDGEQTWVVEASETGPLPYQEGSTVILQNADADLDTLSTVVPLQAVRTEDTMLADSVLWSGLPHDLEYLGSLYARLNRWRHLYQASPLDYSAADAVATWDVWQALSRQFAADPGSWRVYDSYVRPLTPIIRRAVQRGTRLNQERVRAALTELIGYRDRASQIGQAAVGWPINLGSPQQVSKELFETRRIRVPRRNA
jgi:uracil-DNA glycosylase family 4